ncbi:head-tail adaptor protein [Paroceanicella profunda]|uniref:Head-tail adaptor protein n=1 Tax=Paroceanicella profunda TaxID=2579971 RepID=A0A5B8FY59_9RHOB|nr:head-tail adaptor protein [Paroceanicella profunda]QDL92544.1 head-tail adaptor protein [Paroceanicella profunda]
MRAGRLKARLAFDAPVRSPAPGGGTVLGWSEKFRCWGSVIAPMTPPQESEMHERVSGGAVVAPVAGLVTVRLSPDTLGVRDDWRIRDIVSGEPGVAMQIRTVSPKLPGVPSLKFGVVWNAPGEE